TVQYAEKYQNFVIGFIAQSRLSTSSNIDYIHCTPGVHINSSEDKFGQQYISPAEA
ncbi:unnamed protein product, partial [Didymodactylos carnosus]